MWKHATGLFVAATALVIAAPAVAQEDGPPPSVQVEVTLGIDGFVHPEEPLPVVVDLTATELIVGHIEVSSGGTTTDIAIEVPAGGAKRYTLTAGAPGARRSVSVEVFRTKADGSEESVDRSNPRLRIPTNELLVGVIDAAGIETNLRSATPTLVAREVVVVQMTPDMVERQSSVISYIIVGSNGLDDLTADQLVALTRWVRAGGRLYGPQATVVPVADPISGTAWPGTSAVVVRLGEGEVGALDPTTTTVEEWSVLLRGTPTLGLVRNESISNVPFGLVAAASAGREASVPALPWLLGGIVLFVVLIGPANFLLLRRFGKPELAWATVPALSVVFVAGFWVIGRAQLQDFTISAASVVIEGEDGLQGYGGFLLQVEAAGDHEILFADGWDSQVASIAGGVTGSLISTSAGISGLSFELEDLGVGTAQASWSDPTPTGIEVALTSTGNQTEAVVTNNAGSDLWGWGVVVNGVGFVGSDALLQGMTSSLSVRSTANRSVCEPVISEAMSRRGFQLSSFDSQRFGIVNSLAGFAETKLPALRRAGVHFFGFTEGTELGVRVDGRDTTAAGPGLIVKHVEVSGLGGALALGGVQPELLHVTGAASVEAFCDQIFAFGADEVLFTFSVPDGVPAAAQIEPRSAGLGSPELFRWDTGEYEAIEWGTAFELIRYVSPGGELVLRATPPETNQFSEVDINLARYSLKWETA